MAQTQDMDRDIAAIRAMIAEEQNAVETPKKQRKVVPRDTSPRRGISKRAAQAPVTTPARRPRLRPLLVSALHRIMQYQPNTRVILGTSLVLLLLLQPVFVIGSALLLAISVMISYLILGGETFWRRVIAVFRYYSRWFPTAARRLRIRGELAVRKWDRMIERLPDRMEDSLRAPDLRAMARADQKHAEVMVDRLSRLHDESAA